MTSGAWVALGLMTVALIGLGLLLWWQTKKDKIALSATAADLAAAQARATMDAATKAAELAKIKAQDAVQVAQDKEKEQNGKSLADVICGLKRH